MKRGHIHCPVCRRDFGRGRGAMNAMANHTRDAHGVTTDTRVTAHLNTAFNAIFGDKAEVKQ